MGSLRVTDPGIFTTIQDSGRPGYRKTGIPASGAMDSKAYKMANRLVGNSQDAAVLELTLKGGKYEFLTEAVIAITGANMKPERNGISIPMYQSVQMKAGDILHFSYTKRGCRSYLAIQGILESDRVMDSCSTYTPGAFGGYRGRKLAGKDVLSWSTDGTYHPQMIHKSEIPYYSNEVTVPVYPGPEWDWLESSAKEHFLGSQFQTGTDSNRMGIRLEGAEISHPGKEMISSPVIPGIIQLPKSGKPILLHYDGQTIGGYPRIAKVPDSELWRLAQLKPGDTISFQMKEYPY